eukprot:1586608-Rhodomonas_salina.6
MSLPGIVQRDPRQFARSVLDIRVAHTAPHASTNLALVLQVAEVVRFGQNHRVLTVEVVKTRALQLAPGNSIA